MTKARQYQGSFHFIDHTADVGIVASSPTLEGLFETSAFALAELITSANSLRYRIRRQFRLEEDEIETLLVSWLQELLYVFETEGLIFGQFQVNLHNSLLEAIAWGEAFDPDIHTVKTEIKAVTYHQLEVVKVGHGWKAQVIFDI
jgi:SHS2 domain-containing protein